MTAPEAQGNPCPRFPGYREMGERETVQDGDMFRMPNGKLTPTICQGCMVGSEGISLYFRAIPSQVEGRKAWYRGQPVIVTSVVVRDGNHVAGFEFGGRFTQVATISLDFSWDSKEHSETNAPSQVEGVQHPEGKPSRSYGLCDDCKAKFPLPTFDDGSIVHCPTCNSTAILEFNRTRSKLDAPQASKGTSPAAAFAPDTLKVMYRCNGETAWFSVLDVPLVSELADGDTFTYHLDPPEVSTLIDAVTQAREALDIAMKQWQLYYRVELGEVQFSDCAGTEGHLFAQCLAALESPALVAMTQSKGVQA